MSHHSDGYSGAHIVLAFLAGAVGGAAAALLTAPQSGQDTRDTLRGWARDAQSTAPKLPSALNRAYREATNAAREAFTQALREADEETDSSS